MVNDTSPTPPNRIQKTSYFLVRKTVLGHDAVDDTEVLGWEFVPDSERPFPYDMAGKTDWKQIKRTIIEEEV